MKKLFIIILVVVGICIYSSSLSHGFVWDDEEQIVANIQIRSITNIPAFFTGSTFNAGGGAKLLGMYYKPMMSVCFAVLYSIFGPNPFYFHLFQILIHIANAVLIFFVLDFIIGGNVIPFLLSLIFLVHPINVESVVYISALQDVLFFFFGMIGLLLIIRKRYVAKATGDTRGRATDSAQRQSFGERALAGGKLVAGPVAFFLFSLLSKETGIAFFVIVFVCLFLFQKKSLKTYVLFSFGCLALYFFMRFVVAGVDFGKIGPSPIMKQTLTIRLINIPKIVYFYISTFFFPKNLAIAQHWVVKTINVRDFYIPLFTDILFMVLTFAPIFLVRTVEKRKTYIFFYFWFLLGLGIHLQIFPLDMTVAERWFYLPMVGLLGIIGVLVGKIQDITIITIIKIITVITVILFSIRSVIRIQDWKSGLTLYGADIKVSKDAFDLANNYGVELFRSGKSDEAFKYFEESTRLAPHWWTNWNNLGAIYQRKGNMQKAEEYYKKAIQNGNYYMAYENYLGLLLQQKRYTEAYLFLKNEALPLFPHNKQFTTIFAVLQKNVYHSK